MTTDYLTHGQATVLGVLAKTFGGQAESSGVIVAACRQALSRAQSYKALDALAAAGLVTTKADWPAHGIALTEAGRLEAAALAAANAVRSGAVPADGAPETCVPLDRLRPSDLNPRRQFADEAIEELAQSIAQVGLLQNLIVRPAGEDAGMFEIVAGERRWRAMRLLVARGDWREDAPVPVRIVEIDDAQALMLAIAENAQREDVHPLDEGEAFLALYERTAADGGDAGQVAARIAAEVGKTRRWVEKRMALARRLSAEVREAFRAGRLTLAQAQALAPVGETVQQAALQRILDGNGGWQTADQITASLRARMVPVAHAWFDCEDYPGRILDIEGVPHFDDRKTFLSLQAKAIDRRVESERARGRAFVEVEAYYRAWLYQQAPDDLPEEETGLVIVPPTEWSTETIVHDRLVLRDKGDGEHAGAPDADPEEPEWSRRHLDWAAGLRTDALQAALAERPEVAEAVLIVALLRAVDQYHDPSVRLSVDDDLSGSPDNAARRRLLALLREHVGEDLVHPSAEAHAAEGYDAYGEPDPSSYPRLKRYRDAEAFRRLLAVKDDDRRSLLAACVAVLVRAGGLIRRQPVTPSLAYAIAEALGFPRPTARIDGDYARLLTQRRRRRLAIEAGVDPAMLDGEHPWPMAGEGYAEWLVEHATKPIEPPELGWILDDTMMREEEEDHQ